MSPPSSDTSAPSIESLRLRVALAALALYVLACATPAVAIFDTNAKKNDVMFGLPLLLVGWLGAFVLNFGWFANLFLPVAGLLRVIGKYRAAAVFGSLAFLVGLHTLYWYVKPMPANEGFVGELQLRYPSVGFYFWLASMLVIVVGALVLHRRTLAIR
jgi:hypothetical protein